MAGVADKNALKAGIFIVTAAALALTVFFLVGRLGFSRDQTWTIRFDVADDVSGVGPGADVRIGGVAVGEVTSVGISDDFRHVDVKVTLPNEVVLRSEPRVVIQATVTGVAWLNFDSLGDGEPIPPGGVIVGDAGTISNLVAAANRLAPAVTGLVDDVRDTTLPKVNEVLGKTSNTIDNVDSTVSRFGEAADRTANAAQTVEELLERNRENLDATLASLRQASERAPRLIDDANILVNNWSTAADSVRETLDGTGERLDALLADAQVIAGDLKETSKETSATVKDVHSIISGNRGKIETIITRMRDTSSTLNLASSEIRRSPWRLLYRPDGTQRESLDLYDSARRFAEGAASLQDAAIALGDAANDPAADPAKVDQLLVELQQKFQEFDRVERALYERLK
jgi:phospholipid/cholesterol/gamma-HCH transport system substrate-binding protein